MTTAELARRLGFADHRTPTTAPDSAELTLGYEAAYPFAATPQGADEDGEPLDPVQGRE